MRDTAGRNQKAAAAATEYAKEHGVELRPIELDVGSQASVDAAIAKIVADSGRLDVVIQNAGHMVLGPAEAFSAEEIDEIFDTNVLGDPAGQSRGAPPPPAAGAGPAPLDLEQQREGRHAPYLGPYFAAKAAMDSLAVTYADELARWGVETTIIVPGSFTTGTNHFANAGHPADAARASEYEQHYAGLSQQVADRLAALAPPNADPTDVARAVVAAVDAAGGEAPLPGPRRPGRRRFRRGQRRRRPHPRRVPQSGGPGRPAEGVAQAGQAREQRAHPVRRERRILGGWQS